MITHLDHIVLVCPDIETGAATYTAILGIPPVWRSRADGAASALFQVANTALELIAPAGEGRVGARLAEIIEADGPGLKSLAFGTEDIEVAHRLSARRGLAPSDITHAEARDETDAQTRKWSRFRLSDDKTHGIKTFIIRYDTGALQAPESADDGVHALDHLVVETPNPDRAAAHYGARLGLDLRLDRTIEDFKTRFQFFKTGGLTFEIISRTDSQKDEGGKDAFMGLTWAVKDIRVAHARLAGSGLEISEIRAGRKPGSEVFTIGNGTLNVPTLFIAHSPR